MIAGDIDIGMGAGPEMAFIAKGSPELAICNADPAPKFLELAVIFATDSIMKSHPAAVRDFLGGWLDTIAWIRNHRDATVKIEAGITHFPLPVQAKEYDLTIEMFSSSCKFDAETLANLKRSFVELGLVSSPPDMTKLYTEKFIPKHS